DLDQGQAKELGLALANIEPKYIWNEHLTYIFKNIKQLIIEISTATTKLQIEEIFETLKKFNNENLEAESSHAQVNQYGTNLYLQVAIQKKRKYPTTEKKQQTTRPTIKKNKSQKNSKTDLDETERNLAIREKQLELEEHEAELELKRLNIKKMKKDLNL
ncbi:8892_t:CDS:2, partial [Scutellospora calospora]